MTIRYHINKKGVPAVCQAQPGNCPLGNEGEHFDTPEAAQIVADKLHEHRYKGDRNSDLLSHPLSKVVCKDYEGMTSEEKIRALQDLAFQIKLFNMDQNELLESMGLSKGGRLHKSIQTEFECAKLEVGKIFDDEPSIMHIPRFLSQEKRAELKEVLKKMAPEASAPFPAHVVWESENYYFAWTSDNKLFDFITYNKNTERVTAMEIKDFSTGSQFHQTVIEQNSDGSLIPPDMERITPKIREELLKYNPLESWNSNKPIDLTQDEALRYVVQAHIDGGCTKFAYKGKDGQHNRIWLKSAKDPSKIDEDVAQMKALHISAEVKIRLNNSSVSRVVNDNDVEYFKNNEAYGHFFKLGKQQESFTPRDTLVWKNCVSTIQPTHSFDKFGQQTEISPEKRQKSLIRFGEFILKDVDINTREVNIREFKRMRPHITGTLKHKPPKTSEKSEDEDYGFESLIA